MGVNAKSYEDLKVVATIDPDAASAGTVTSGWIAAADFQRFLVIIMAGDLGSSATLDAKLQQASDSSGTGAKDITGKAITQLTQAGTDSDKQVLMHVDASDLDVDNSFTHFRVSMTVATAASEIAAIVLGMEPTRSYIAQKTSVDELVA